MSAARSARKGGKDAELQTISQRSAYLNVGVPCHQHTGMVTRDLQRIYYILHGRSFGKSERYSIHISRGKIPLQGSKEFD